MNTRYLYEAVVELVAEFSEIATKAVKFGQGYVFVPGTLDRAAFEKCCKNPDLIRAGDGSGKEPAYISLAEGQQGRNSDGSPHNNGFFVLDPINRKIVSVVDINGKDIFDINVYSGSFVQARWSGYQINYTNHLNQQVEIETRMGIRGMSDVFVFEDNWIVKDSSGNEVPIKKVLVSETRTEIVKEINF